ncbi:Long-chain-fatty-acid--CoA ligase [compost metagenome]
MYWALLNFHHQQLRDEDISNSLRLCVSGGASLAVKVLQDFQDRFNVQVIEGYGMSEGSPVVTFNDIRLGCKPGSIGLPVWGVDVKIIDQDGNTLPNYETGELVFRGHNVMKGYYNKHTATEEVIENGWMHSGDVAYRDDEGFYFIVDRTKDMIIRGGMNVYSREVEEIMMKHPAISLVAVIGIPDEKLGEEIKAVVVLKEQEEISEDELMRWTKDRLAKYKYPRVIHFANALPISATGKILKKELRAADNEKLNK